jgi:hypothetical protein
VIPLSNALWNFILSCCDLSNQIGVFLFAYTTLEILTFLIDLIFFVCIYHIKNAHIFDWQGKVLIEIFFFANTVKPVLTTTSEQWPPANNSQPESPALLNLLWLYLVCLTNLWIKATFLGSQGWSLYTGLNVPPCFLCLKNLFCLLDLTNLVSF